MFSFATRPVIEATAACQLPQPCGIKSQQIAFPIMAKDAVIDLILGEHLELAVYNIQSKL